MLPLRYSGRWRAAGMMLLLLVLAATMMPAVWFWSDKHDFITWFVDVDKWLHGITFILLALWFAGQYRPESYWRIGIGLILFGALIEGCQRLVTYRSADSFDILADTAGIIVGLSIAAAGAGGWSLRFENWYMRRRVGANDD
jgi:glycopeptide antibiotics resistance protein